MGGSMQLAFALGLLFVYKGLAARSSAFNPDDFEDDGDDEFGGSAAKGAFDEDESGGMSGADSSSGDDEELGATGKADSFAGDDADDDGFISSPSSSKSSSMGRADSHAGDDGDDDGFGASPSSAKSSSRGRAESHAGDDGDEDGFGASPSSAKSSSRGRAESHAGDDGVDDGFGASPSSAKSSSIGRVDSDAGDDGDDDRFGALRSPAKSSSGANDEESGAVGRADSHARDNGNNGRFGARRSSAKSSSGSKSFQPMDLVYFAKDGIMILNPKRKTGEPERLSRYKAGQLGQIRKVVGRGRYIVCIGKVQKTTAGMLGLSRRDKQGTKCPGGEVELRQSDLKAKTETMEVWDDKAQDMKVTVVDVFGVGQRVKVLRPGKIKSGKAWDRNTAGVVSQVLKGNKYMVCVGGELRNNLGRISCTGAGFVSFPAYQLQKLNY